MKLDKSEAKVVAELLDACRASGACNSCVNRKECNSIKKKLIEGETQTGE